MKRVNLVNEAGSNRRLSFIQKKVSIRNHSPAKIKFSFLKIIIVVLQIIFISIAATDISYSQYFWSGTKKLTYNSYDRNPSFGMKNRFVNPYTPYEFLVFERWSLINYVNICAIKMGFNGNFDSVFYVTSGNNICRNPSVDYYTSLYTSFTTVLVVWEQYENSRWNLYGRRHYSTTGWGNIFPIDTTAYNKSNPSVGRLYSDYSYGVAYERNNDIIYREFDINTGLQTYELNLTSSDTAVCRKPTISVENTYGNNRKFIAYERQKPDGQFSIYMRNATSGNVWTNPDTVTTVANNRNPRFVCGSGGSEYLTFESDRNGKWNLYSAEIYNISVSSIENLYINPAYNCRSFSSFFYPVITDFYSYLSSFVRQGNDSVKIISGSGYSTVIIADSITIGDTSYKPLLSVGRGVGQGKGYTTIWMVYNKDSLSYSMLYAKYRIILLDDVKRINNGQPDKYSLMQNYPNPFNSSTVIRFDIPLQDNIKITVHDITGKEAAVLVNGIMKAGKYEVKFNADRLNSGIYFCRLVTDNSTETKKMVLLK